MKIDIIQIFVYKKVRYMKGQPMTDITWIEHDGLSIEEMFLVALTEAHEKHHIKFEPPVDPMWIYKEGRSHLRDPNNHFVMLYCYSDFNMAWEILLRFNKNFFSYQLEWSNELDAEEQDKAYA